MRKPAEQNDNRRIKESPEDDSSIGLGFMFSKSLSDIQGPQKRSRFIPSTLTIRILMINLLAPVLLVVGTLYIDEYHEGLVKTEMQTLQMQAAFLAEAASINAQNLKPLKIDNITKQLPSLSNTHIRIFDTKTTAISDNKNNTSWIKKDTNISENSLSIMNVALYVYNDTMRSLVGGKKIEEYVDTSYSDNRHLKDLDSALQNGIGTATIKHSDTFGTVLSVVQPVFDNDKIIAAVMLESTTQNIKLGITSLQIAVFRLFVVALLTSIILSLYLAKTITRPIQRLASAANTIRKGNDRQAQIPDLSNRYDEIGDLSSSLSAMTSALWMRLDMMESFAADVAHELKNPITSLSSAVETLTRVKSPEKQEKLVNIIKHDTKRMNRLVSDISSLSKLDAELSRSKLASVKLVDLMTDMLKNYSLRTIDYKDYLEEQETPSLAPDDWESKYDKPVTIVKDFSGAIYGRVIGEENLLRQVFQNLIDNAISFSPNKGHVFLRVTGDKFVIVDVEDEGNGIIEGKEKHIFERFFSERPKEEGFGKHSGLGLSICKRILDGLGGYIIAQNRVKLDLLNEEEKENLSDEKTENQTNEIIGARFSVFLKRA